MLPLKSLVLQNSNNRVGTVTSQLPSGNYEVQFGTQTIEVSPTDLSLCSRAQALQILQETKNQVASKLSKLKTLMKDCPDCAKELEKLFTGIPNA